MSFSIPPLTSLRVILQLPHTPSLSLAVSIRLKAVSNIQKITKSMKMVSAAKYAKAERELKPARSYGLGVQSFFDHCEVKQESGGTNHLIVAMTSDRGLCGAVHTSIARAIKAAIPEKPSGATVKLICIGDKSKAILGRSVLRPHSNPTLHLKVARTISCKPLRFSCVITS